MNLSLSSTMTRLEEAMVLLHEAEKEREAVIQTLRKVLETLRLEEP